MSANKPVIKTPALRSSASVFAALGDETRLRLVAILCAGTALSITQLTVGTELTRQAVTKHLTVLAEAGLVKDVKVGRERLWQFDPQQIEAAQNALALISNEWDKRLLQLKSFVEGAN